MTDVLVTGGTGFVGRHLVAALQDRGYSVRTLLVPAEDAGWLAARDVAVYRGDIRDPDTLAAPMRGVEIVFHLAAAHGLWLSMDDYHKINVTGTENVCRAALAEGVRRLVHVSSWTVYGMGLGKPVCEDSPLTPLRDPYAITKAEADKRVRRMIAEEQLPATVVRPGTIFGPGDRVNLGRIADRLRAGKGLVIGSGRNALPLVYVTDVVRGLLLCASVDRAQGQAYNITNDQPLTQEEFVGAIAQEVDGRPPRFHIPYHAAYAIAVIAERAVKFTRSEHPIVTRHGVALYGTDNRHSIEKARADLGYTPQVSLREGVGLACRWYLKQPPS